MRGIGMRLWLLVLSVTGRMRGVWFELLRCCRWGEWRVGFRYVFDETGEVEGIGSVWEGDGRKAASRECFKFFLISLLLGLERLLRKFSVQF